MPISSEYINSEYILDFLSKYFILGSQIVSIRQYSNITEMQIDIKLDTRKSTNLLLGGLNKSFKLGIGITKDDKIEISTDHISRCSTKHNIELICKLFLTKILVNMVNKENSFFYAPADLISFYSRLYSINQDILPITSLIKILDPIIKHNKLEEFLEYTADSLMCATSIGYEIPKEELFKLLASNNKSIREFATKYIKYRESE
jgi:hypothetical protein